nr:MAG TPA: Regulatory protein repA [Bacteriophage sp.]
MKYRFDKKDFANAVYALPQSFCDDRDKWLRVIGAIKWAGDHEPGFTPGEALALARKWSRGSDAYNDGDFNKTYDSLRGAGKVANTGYVYKYAIAAGYKPKDGTGYKQTATTHARRHGPGTFEIGDVIDLSGLKPDAYVETGDEMDRPEVQYSQIEKFLSIFEPTDLVNIVYTAEEGDDGRMKPGTGMTKPVSEWLAILKGEMYDGRRFFSTFRSRGYDPAAGVYVRINPLDGRGIGDKNVKAYKYALLESDEIPKDKQRALIGKIGAPVVAIVDSGHKSLHALVRVDARDADEYAERVEFLYKAAAAIGFKPDLQDKNPSRLSRLPGIRRGEGYQKLIYKADPKTVDTFEAWEAVLRFGSPVDPSENWDAWDPSKELSPVLIAGILRKGHKMLIGGPSKAGKSFALIELAAALTNGLQWLGEYQCAQCDVIYINFEIDAASFVNRVHKVYDVFGVKPPPGSLRIFNLRGKLTDPEKFVQYVAGYCKGKNIGAIIIDPLYKLMLGADENSAKDIGLLCSNFDKLASRVGASIIYVHHFSKGSGYSKSLVDTADRVSGSGVFGRDADAILTLTQLEWVPSLDPVTGDFSEETAWRVDTVLREFPTSKSFNIFWEYPIHVIDAGGMLEGARYKGDPVATGAKRGGEVRGEQVADDKGDNITRIIHHLNDVVADEGFVSGEPVMTITDLADDMELTTRTLRNYFSENKIIGYENKRGQIVKT